MLGVVKHCITQSKLYHLNESQPFSDPNLVSRAGPALLSILLTVQIVKKQLSTSASVQPKDLRPSLVLTSASQVAVAYMQHDDEYVS